MLSGDRVASRLPRRRNRFGGVGGSRDRSRVPRRSRPGTSQTDAMKVTVTATMTSGIAASPSEPSTNVATRTEVSGSRSMATQAAPIPIAIAGTRGRPGRWVSRIPTASPRSTAGNVGPPRKAASDPA